MIHVTCWQQRLFLNNCSCLLCFRLHHSTFLFLLLLLFVLLVRYSCSEQRQAAGCVLPVLLPNFPGMQVTILMLLLFGDCVFLVAVTVCAVFLLSGELIIPVIAVSIVEWDGMPCPVP